MMFTTEPSARIKVTGGGHAIHSELIAFLRRQCIRHTWVGAEDYSWVVYFVDAGQALEVAGWLRKHGAEEEPHVQP